MRGDPRNAPEEKHRALCPARSDPQKRGMTEAEYSAKMERWSSWLERCVETGTGG